MATIAPFRALRYDLGRVSAAEAGAVLAPPYDVISEADRGALEARHPRNVVRLDLPRGEGDERYAESARLLDAWVGEGTLREDAAPALYRYEQTFAWAGKTYVRKGFVALVRLASFSERVVLPHEHTLAGPKADRLKLMRATRAHFSQVFALYRDPDERAERVLEAAEASPSVFDAATPDGGRHRLWAITDPTAIGAITAALADKPLMIADGHHRYETMLALRDELRPADRAPGDSMADWGTLFLARAEDPGLLVLPTHRLVKDVADLDGLPARAARWFDVTPGTEPTAAAIETRLVQEGRSRVTFALRRPGGVLWLQLKPDADLTSLGPPALRGLDVTVLHGLLLGPLLGIDAAAMSRQANLLYTHDTADALARVDAGEAQGAFLMNATKIEQVLSACEGGFVLPQKSTYFQPKLATGIVMARIDPLARPERV